MTDDAGLRDSIEQLSGTISDLRVTVSALGVAVSNLAERASEDRDRATRIAARVSALETWRGRVSGGLALVGVLVIAVGGTIAAWILK